MFRGKFAVPAVLVGIVAGLLVAIRGDPFSQIRVPPAGPRSAWVSIGPTPNAYSYGPADPTYFNSGRVASIAIDPSDPTHWLIGFGNGGIWETHDTGASFLPITDNAPILAMGAIAFAPSDPLTIYAATGEATGTGPSLSGVGILKSTDGAKTWTLIAASNFARAAVKRIRVHPSNPNLLLAAISRAGFGRDAFEASPNPPPFGILESTDGGVTWVRTLGGQASALEVDPSNFNSQYAAIGDQRVSINFNFALAPGSASYNDPPGDAVNGVYRSTDGGQTWAPVAGPWGVSTPQAATVGWVELAISRSNPDTIYASIQVPPNGGSAAQPLLGLFRTDNAWAATPTWIQIPTGATGAYGYCGPNKCGFANTISVDPSTPDTLYAFGAEGGGGAYKCTSCGLTPTWTAVAPNYPLHPDHHVIAWSGNRLIDGNDGGLWSSTDGANTWQNHNATISTNMFLSGALHPSNPNFILGGIKDFSISIRNGASTWVILPEPSRGGEWGEAEVALSSSSPDTDWMAGEGFGVINRTTDGGMTGMEADQGIDMTGAALVAPVRKCPSNDDVFLTGTNRMWRSNNFFSGATPTWVSNSPADTYPYPNTIGAPNTILSIAYVASDPACNTYAYGTRIGAVSLTRDGGNTWTDLDPSKTLPPRPVNGLAFDPTNPNVLYVGLSSFDDATPGQPGHVFKTTNALSSAPAWVNVSPPLNQPFNVIAVDPANPAVVYAGSDTGLYRSVDGAARWRKQNGLPNAPIYDVKINPNTGQTVVFTWGRGAYALQAAPAVQAADPGR
jgi:photosystem II stability/assembly factor-like uncharacterized protein